MGLSWDATAVKGYDTLTEDEAVTRDALTFACMAIGIGEITESNVEEFYARINLWEKVNGNYRYIDGKSVPFSRADVRRFIGLRTNVFPKMTDAKFARHIFDTHVRFLPKD